MIMIVSVGYKCIGSLNPPSYYYFLRNSLKEFNHCLLLSNKPFAKALAIVTNTIPESFICGWPLSQFTLVFSFPMTFIIYLPLAHSPSPICARVARLCSCAALCCLTFCCAPASSSSGVATKSTLGFPIDFAVGKQVWQGYLGLIIVLTHTVRLAERISQK